MDNENPSQIYTIGYGARDSQAFLAVVQTYQIAYVLDVRSKPYSRYKTEFSKKELGDFLEANGIRYVFMGDMLGGQPEDPSCYTDGKVDYDKVAQKEFYQKGIVRLQEASRKGLHVAIMCSEGKPEMCHRTKLISRTLIQLGIEVRHINEEDQLITQEQAMYRLTDHQPSLFGDEFFKFTSRKRYQDQEE